MLAELQTFRDTVSLIPDSGIQFLDFGLGDGAATAVRPFHDRWVPLPFLRSSGGAEDGRPDSDGPTNWCRARIAPLDRADAQGNHYRLTMAFDTKVVPGRGDQPYLAPCSADVDDHAGFVLASRPGENARFLAAEWVRRWLAECLTQQDGESAGAAETRRQAAYRVLLAELHPILPRVFFSGGGAALDVDLVLDVGNCRTCGLLVERGDGHGIDINTSYPLALRDLTFPHRVQSEPFPSRIEFSRPTFGNDQISRMSDRGDAFVWPSVARVGHEAQALSHCAHASDITGLSSPKRYIWDCASRRHPWQFNPGPDSRAGGRPVTVGALLRLLGSDGERAPPGGDGPEAPLFSRSSLMMFFLVEVFQQALTQINAPAIRYRRAIPEAPRRLRRIIMTVPTTMPQAERRLYLRRATLAAELLWRVLNKPGDAPVPSMDADEASATQAVYLYNECRRNFRGDLSLLFHADGRRRDADAAPSMRVATIDIGGGTTDMVVNTYRLGQANTIIQRQDIREGINIAGDDIVARVIEDIILPALADTLAATGARLPRRAVTELVGANRSDQPHRHQVMRRHFANQICVPLALALVTERGRRPTAPAATELVATAGDVLTGKSRPAPEVLDFVDTHFRDAGSTLKLMDGLCLRTTVAALDDAVELTLMRLIDDICELIALHDCDVVLLSGQLARLTTVRQAVIALLPARVDKVVSMGDYRVGDWYPFRDDRGRVADPKTTASVGALVATLARRGLDGFALAADETAPRMVRHFGILEQDNRIKAGNVVLVDTGVAGERSGSGQLPVNGGVFLGYRQFAAEHWPARPLYRLQAADGVRDLVVTLGISAEEDGALSVLRVNDRHGGRHDPCTATLTLQTLRDPEGYWTDTGIFSVPPDDTPDTGRTPS